MKGNAEFKIINWNETSFSEMENAGKLSRASINKTYAGDIQGEGVLELLMAYQSDGSATFLGIERVIGNVKGKSGSFVFQHSGTFQNGEMTQVSHIIPGSGTNELSDLSANCSVSAGHQESYPFYFEYEFE